MLPIRTVTFVRLDKTPSPEVEVILKREKRGITNFEREPREVGEHLIAFGGRAKNLAVPCPAFSDINYYASNFNTIESLEYKT